MSHDALSPLGSDSVSAAAGRRADPAYNTERERRAPYERIARLVIVHRMKTGLTQKALATQLGTSESAISRLERGDHAPNLDTLRRLADVFGKDLVVDFADFDHEREATSAAF